MAAAASVSQRALITRTSSGCGGGYDRAFVPFPQLRTKLHRRRPTVICLTWRLLAEYVVTESLLARAELTKVGC